MSKVSVAGGSFPTLEKQWKSITRMLLGQEAEGLTPYTDWLCSGNGPRLIKTSSTSGKDVVFAFSDYAPNSRFASFDEVALDAKYSPLSINEIKDLDSVFEAIADRATYCGNIVLGNSEFVDSSTAITNSHYILHSERIAFSKYVAYSTRGSYSENIFGCLGFGPAKFLIKCDNAWDCNRSVLLSRSDFSSDCYYSHGLSGCSDCLFSFNLKNKRNCIGNLILPKEKYVELKSRLLQDISERLFKDKSLPSISDLCGKIKPDYSLLNKTISTMPNNSDKQSDKSVIEKTFSETARVLGFGLSSIDQYSIWLSRGSRTHLEPAKSCASGKPLLVPDSTGYLRFPRDRLILLREAEYFGEKLSLSLVDVDSLSIDSAPEILSKIAFFCPYWEAGNSQNNFECPISIDSSNGYRSIQNMLSNKCALCVLARNCESCFGCRESRESSFCFNCHFSTKLSRCFEMDSCNNCSGCYFCHNCENVHDSMFCFNTKNKRYAIGNVEIGREKFLEIKKKLLDEINTRLKKDKTLDFSIYSFGKSDKSFSL